MPTEKNLENAPQLPAKLPNKVTTRVEEFSGPLPHPKTLAEYEKLYPGAAKKIFEFAETQINHRQEMEVKLVTSNISHEKMGLVLGFILLFSLVIIGAFLVFYDKNATGYFLMFTGAGAPLASFLYARYQDRQKEEE